jgi:hypothetical protein
MALYATYSQVRSLHGGCDVIKVLAVEEPEGPEPSTPNTRHQTSHLEPHIFLVAACVLLSSLRAHCMVHCMMRMLRFPSQGPTFCVDSLLDAHSFTLRRGPRR